MAAAPTLLNVRIPGGHYESVELVPELSPQDVKEIVAGAVGLPVGTFILKSDADGRTTGFHAGLTGNWTTVLLPTPAAAPAVQGWCVGDSLLPHLSIRQRPANSQPSRRYLPRPFSQLPK